jgi:hypothetical protein
MENDDLPRDDKKGSYKYKKIEQFIRPQVKEII